MSAGVLMGNKISVIIVMMILVSINICQATTTTIQQNIYKANCVAQTLGYTMNESIITNSSGQTPIAVGANMTTYPEKQPSNLCDYKTYKNVKTNETNNCQWYLVTTTTVRAKQDGQYSTSLPSTAPVSCPDIPPCNTRPPGGFYPWAPGQDVSGSQGNNQPLGMDCKIPACTQYEFADQAGYCSALPCAAGQVRNGQGICADPTCIAPQTLYNHNCVDPCFTGSSRNTTTGSCECPAGKDQYLQSCVDKCQTGFERGIAGSCKKICAEGEENYGENCVKKCETGQHRGPTTGMCIGDTPTSPPVPPGVTPPVPVSPTDIQKESPQPGPEEKGISADGTTVTPEKTEDGIKDNRGSTGSWNRSGEKRLKVEKAWDTTRHIDWLPLHIAVQGFQDKTFFPIFNQIGSVYGGLVSAGSAPQFEVPFWGGNIMHINLSVFNPLASFVKKLLGLIIMVGTMYMLLKQWKVIG